MRKSKFNEYVIEGDTVHLKINHKSLVFWFDIDLEDLDKLLTFGHRWCARYSPNNNAYYVQCNVKSNGKTRIVILSRFLLNYSGKMKVDHVDHNTFNNKKRNLRIIENHQNLKHRKSKNKNNTSGHRNVSWINGYWRVQLQINGKNKLFPEKFEEVEDAGKFAIKMRDKYYGKYSGKN